MIGKKFFCCIVSCKILANILSDVGTVSTYLFIIIHAEMPSFPLTISNNSFNILHKYILFEANKHWKQQN